MVKVLILVLQRRRFSKRVCIWGGGKVFKFIGEGAPIALGGTQLAANLATKGIVPYGEQMY